MAEVERVVGRHLARPIRQSPVRNAVRFPIALPLTIHTDHGQIQAMTENISANGLLFVCDDLPEVKSTIEFTMVMPSAIMGSDKDVGIYCTGRIVRHQQDGRIKKAAVVIDEYFLKA
jgi:hypothetical protein